MMTHRDGFPRLSARSAWCGDAGHQAMRPVRKLWETAVPVAQANRQRANRQRANRVGASESLDDVPQDPRLPFYPPAGPRGSPAQSLWVIVSAPWYKPPGWCLARAVTTRQPAHLARSRPAPRTIPPRPGFS